MSLGKDRKNKCRHDLTNRILRKGANLLVDALDDTRAR